MVWQKFDEYIENLKWKQPSIDKCSDCQHFTSKRCQGGCLTYKGKFFNNPLDGGCITGCSMSFYDRHAD
jgi:hypothetical protein